MFHRNMGRDEFLQSPSLFNIYAEEIVMETWEEVIKGVKVGGEIAKADDKAMRFQKGFTGIS